jgi:DNA polymerase-4
MDAFFSSVEQIRRPELAGKPVVVGGEGDPTKRGVVSAASYEARPFGIHSAMPLRLACKLCPEATFLPVDYEEYTRASGEIKAILKEVTPMVEDVGIDEAFLDISSIDRGDDEIAREIKKRIRETTGLTCSIGIAPNKLLAKIASDLEKPDGLTILTERDIETRIWPLPARKLRGVGPKTEAYLKKMGVQTIGEVAALPLERLVEEFGQSYGNYLYEASRGIDESQLITHWEPKSISRETTFQRDIADWQLIAKDLVGLVRGVVAGMKEEGYQGRTVTVKVRFSDFKTYTRAKSLDGFTDSEVAFKRAAFDCLSRFELKKKVRLIGFRISNLKKAGNE